MKRSKKNPPDNTDDMTDHHHSIGAEASHHQSKGHGAKGWKTWLAEFFMLFFAVFCGFQAEYLLEHKIERDREKQFIVSMIKEIKLDSEELSRVQADSTRWKKLDTLALNILGGDRSVENLKKIYVGYMKNVTSYWYMSFNRNTLTQLKSAGNMRLIRNLSVVDSLNQLDNLITYTEKSLAGFNNFQTESAGLMGKIINHAYRIKDGKWTSLKTFEQDVRTSGFITRDEQLLNEFGNAILALRVLLQDYHGKLEDYRKFSVRLVDYLKKEYHLESD